MIRTIFIYGLISGAVVCAGIMLTFLLPNAHGSVWLGYLIMLVALSSIFVGVKQYRDDVQGGVIGFWKALGVGLGIATMAGVGYVIVWEGYLAITHYTFADVYIKSVLAAKRTAGVSGAEYQKTVAAMNEFRTEYANPLFRVPMTFAEIFPVGLLIAVVSAALLRYSRFLPKRA